MHKRRKKRLENSRVEPRPGLPRIGGQKVNLFDGFDLIDELLEETVHRFQSLDEEAGRPYVRPFYWLSDETDPTSYKGGASFFALQIRTLDRKRLVKRLGALSDTPLGTTLATHCAIFQP